MGYPNYAWIVPSQCSEQRWVEDNSSRPTSEAFLFGAIEISDCPINMEESVVTISGKVSIQFRLYILHLSNKPVYCLMTFCRLFKNLIWSSG